MCSDTSRIRPVVVFWIQDRVSKRQLILNKETNATSQVPYFFRLSCTPCAPTAAFAKGCTCMQVCSHPRMRIYSPSNYAHNLKHWQSISGCASDVMITSHTDMYEDQQAGLRHGLVDIMPLTCLIDLTGST